MILVSIRNDLGDVFIPDAREDYRTCYSRDDLDGQKVIYQHPETGDVIVLLDDKRMAVLYSIDLDFEEVYLND